MSDPIDDFWRCFLDHRVGLESLSDAEDPLYDLVLAALQQVHEGLYFEFCSTPGCNEFIVTADGDRELFHLVEEIIAKAPALKDWKFFALKPKLGFPRTMAWEGHAVVIVEVIAQPTVDHQTGELELQLFVAGWNEEDDEAIHNALLRAMDHGLGERRFAESVSSTWVSPLSELPEEGLSFPLVTLESYLDSLAADSNSHG